MQLATCITDHFVNNCSVALSVIIFFVLMWMRIFENRIISQYGVQLIYCIKEPTGKMSAGNN